MFETTLKYKSIDLFENTQVFSATNITNESLDTSFKRTKHLSRRKATVEEFTCIGCNHTHNKTDRTTKKYGVLTTNHCPKCSCESFWLA